MSKGKACPRECGNNMFAITRAGFNPNPKSKVDDKYICNECYIKELYDEFSRNNSL